jgi:hypothetical protein
MLESPLRSIRNMKVQEVTVTGKGTLLPYPTISGQIDVKFRPTGVLSGEKSEHKIEMTSTAPCPECGMGRLLAFVIPHSSDRCGLEFKLRRPHQSTHTK